MTYSSKAPPTQADIFKDSAITGDDKYFLNPVTDSKIIDLNLDGDLSDPSPRIKSDISSYNLTVPGSYTINVTYHTVDDEYISFGIPVEIVELSTQVELTKGVKDTASPKKAQNFNYNIKNIFKGKNTKLAEDGIDSPREKLTHTYKIKNNNASVEVSNILLKDPLDDPDLNLNTVTNITGFYDLNNNGIKGGVEENISGLGSDLVSGITIDKIPA